MRSAVSSQRWSEASAPVSSAGFQHGPPQNAGVALPIGAHYQQRRRQARRGTATTGWATTTLAGCTNTGRAATTGT